MQIIEHSIVGTRSAVVRFRRPGSDLEFVVFPMVHIASPAFYVAVAERLRHCDLLVVEGIRGHSPLRSALTLTYRLVPANRRSGLVVDNIAYQSLGVPLLTPDMTAAEFSRSWRGMRLRHRIAVWCLLPVATIAQLLAGRRLLLTPDIELDDLPTREDAESGLTEELDRVLGDERDERLLEALSQIVRTRFAERISVAVVYGAAHIPAVVHGLYNRHGYRPYAADWLTIMDA